MTKKRKRAICIVVFLALLFLILFSAFFIAPKILFPLKYKEFVEKYSQQHELEPALVFAVIKAESGYNKDAKSHKNAYGLMQITDNTLIWLQYLIKTEEMQDMTVEDLYDPETNIKLGTYLLKYNLNKYSDIKTSLCAYNAGIARIDGWLLDSRYSQDGKVITKAAYKETEKYSEKVMMYMKIYKALYYSE
ncbi:MAG: lytic transglycosylase domain-containing protein [Ruminococcaceae bacterium]|nr:lytic transglycosylase domain-containing protein [Oscillospiraceae bacterium]